MSLRVSCVLVLLCVVLPSCTFLLKIPFIQSVWVGKCSQVALNAELLSAGSQAAMLAPAGDFLYLFKNAAVFDSPVTQEHCDLFPELGAIGQQKGFLCCSLVFFSSALVIFGLFPHRN